MNRQITLPLMLVLMIAFFATDGFAQAGRGRGRQGNNPRSANGRAVNDQGSAMLRSMREEEKLARDVYLAMEQTWGDAVFGTIAQAESRHMAALAGLLKQYGVADSIVDDTPGRFPSAKFQQLYDSLVQTGSGSLVDAYKVGLKIEEMDIADLRAVARTTSNRDASLVLENLERGSRNHLRAFAGRLLDANGTYVATSLSQADFNEIAASPNERGGGQGRGQRGGQGMGQGRGQRGGQGMGQGMGDGQGCDQGGEGMGQRNQYRRGQGNGQGMGQGNGQGMGQGNGQGMGQRRGRGGGNGMGRGKGRGRGGNR